MKNEKSAVSGLGGGLMFGDNDEDKDKHQDEVSSGFGLPRHPTPPADDSSSQNGTDDTSGHGASANDFWDSDEIKDLPETTIGGADDLLNIKQQALQQLTPLVGHLDQNPEERFRTTMMMIQASDDQSLIKEAYAAAQEIKDDKVRAQSLLDIINEINYFTQKHHS